MSNLIKRITYDPIAKAFNFLTSGGEQYPISVSPLKNVGDTVYGGANGVATRLPGNTSATKQFLTSTGTGTAANAPALGTIVGADVPLVVPGTSNGVISSSGVPGNTSGSAIAAGYVGEMVWGPSNKSAVQVNLVNATATQVQTISIPSAGVWAIFVNAQILSADNTTSYSLTNSSDFTISAVSASMNGIYGGNAGFDYGSMFIDNSTNESGKIASGNIYIVYVTTGAKTLYVNYAVYFTGSAPRGRCGIQAVRIA